MISLPWAGKGSALLQWVNTMREESMKLNKKVDIILFWRLRWRREVGGREGERNHFDSSSFLFIFSSFHFFSLFFSILFVSLKEMKRKFHFFYLLLIYLDPSTVKKHKKWEEVELMVTVVVVVVSLWWWWWKLLFNMRKAEIILSSKGQCKRIKKINSLKKNWKN